MKNLALMVILAVSLTACKTNKKYNADIAAAKESATLDAQADAVRAANFIASLQKAAPSTTYTLVKFAQDNANFVVFSYGSGSTYYYAAVDISAYTTGTSANAYVSGHTYYNYLTNNGNGTFSCNAGMCSNISGPASSTMVFENTVGTSKDMEKAAALAEAITIENTAANIAAEFGLSEDRSVEVAKLAASWNKLAQSRALTNADADAFSQELAGVSMADMADAEKAMINGSASEMNAVLAKAAAVNGTTSENMALIMSKLFE